MTAHAKRRAHDCPKDRLCESCGSWGCAACLAEGTVQIYPATNHTREIRARRALCPACIERENPTRRTEP